MNIAKTKSVLWSIFVAVFTVAFCSGWNIQAQHLPVPTEECMLQKMQIRDGLPNFYDKIKNTKDEIRVAYFGGSITAGAGSSKPEYCYRARLTDALQKRLSDRKVTEIYAALGGTGSYLGAFRADMDCISKNPDLVVVEFAVNDAGAPSREIIASLEGIIWQIWDANEKTDIVFVYTATKAMFPTYQNGKLPESVLAHEKVAAHYGIPSINVGSIAAQMVNEEKWTTEEFSKDGVHPTDACYEVYADVIKACYKETFSKFESNKSNLSAKRKQASLSASPLSPARLIPASSATMNGDWKQNVPSPCGYFPSVIASDTPGAELTLHFTGSRIGIFAVWGVDSGVIEYQIDDSPWEKRPCFDQWAKQFNRPCNAELASGLSVTKQHVLRLRVSEEQPEGSKGRMIRLGYFLVASPKPALPSQKVIDAAKPLFEKEGHPDGWHETIWSDVGEPGPEGALWSFKDGVLHGSNPRGTWLVSDKEYGDFYIEFEFLLPRRGNSGFGVHFPDKGDPAFDGMEIQMCDTRYYTETGYDFTPGEITGCIYKAILPRVEMFRPGEWNKYQITVQGSNIWVVLNNETIIKRDLDTETRILERGKPLSERPRRGHIGFQELCRGGDHVMIRNIKINEF